MSVSTDKNFDEKLLKLKAWLKEIYGECEVAPHESSIASGFSNETFVFDVNGENVSESLVLRLRPTGYQVFPEYDLKKQASIMKLLRSKGLPTPQIMFENYSDDILGSEFYVMRYVDGSAPTDNPPHHMDPEGMMGKANKDQRHSVWLGWLNNLCDFHNLNLSDEDLLSCGFKVEDDLLGKDLAYYKEFLDWGMENEPHPVCSKAYDWLISNKPKLQKVSLCWGDSRIGNVLYKNYKCSALLDWEMASLGDPLMDLAWGFAVDECNSIGLGVDRLDGSMSQSDGISIWETATNLSAENIDYFRVLALFKFSVIMVRVGKRLIYNEIMPLDSDFHINNFTTEFLDSEVNKVYDS